MIQLHPLELDDVLLEQIQQRAVRHGISVEDEVQMILRRAVALPERVGDLATHLFGARHGFEISSPERLAHDAASLPFSL